MVGKDAFPLLCGFPAVYLSFRFLSLALVFTVSISLSFARFVSLALVLLPPPVCLSLSLSLRRCLALSLSRSLWLSTFSLSLSLSLFLSFFLFLCHFLSVVSLFFISRQLSGSVTFAVSDSRALLRGLSDVPLGFNFDIEENANFRDFKRATVYPSAAGL